MGIRDWTISTRFIVTMGHFTCLLILFSTYEENVQIGLADSASDSDRRKARTIAITSLIFGSFCFGLDFLGLFVGTSLFIPTINMLQIFFHFVGSIFLSWLITERWNYTALWPIIATCNLPTAILELGVLILVYGLKIYRP